MTVGKCAGIENVSDGTTKQYKYTILKFSFLTIHFIEYDIFGNGEIIVVETLSVHGDTFLVFFPQKSTVHRNQ